MASLLPPGPIAGINQAILPGPGPSTGCDHNRLISSYDFSSWTNTGVAVTSDVPGPFGKDTGSKLVGATGGMRVGFLTAPAIAEDTIIFSFYVKNGNMVANSDTKIGFRDRDAPATYYGGIDWSNEAPVFLDSTAHHVTGTVADVGEYWYRVVAAFDAASAGTEGVDYDARILATNNATAGNTIYVGAAQFESGDGITEARDYCETPSGYAAGQPATTYPYVSSMGVACAPGNQYINATTDVDCYFRFRWEIKAASGKPSTEWSAWTVVASTDFEEILSETPIELYYFSAAVEARDEDNVPMSNETQWDIFQWGIGGACP